MNGIERHYLVPDKGRMLIMIYRFVGIGGSGRGMWDYRPDFSPVWLPVKNPQVVANLDAGKHPRESVSGYSKGLAA